MHKVQFAYSDVERKFEYKEKCANPRCASKTLWVYPKSPGGVYCSVCMVTLQGESLMARQGARILYHRGNNG